MSMRGNVKRTRKEGQLTFLNKAEKIIFYTFQVTNNTKKYPKKWRFTLTNRIQEKALEIYHNLLHANEIYPKTQKDAERRFELQELAIVNCKELDFFIRFSFHKGMISERQLKFWSSLTTELRTIIAGWYNNDKIRFKF